MEANQSHQNDDQSARKILEALMPGQAGADEQEPPRQEREPQEPQYVPKDRFDELLERVRRAEDRSESLTREILQGRGHGQNSQEQYDPEIEEQVRPFLERERQALLGELAPLIQFAKTQMGERYVEESLPGFGDLKEAVKRRFEALPPEQREMYDSAIGAQALAAQELAAQMQAMRKRSSPAPTNRAHSASGSGGPGRDTPDPHSLSSGAFEGLLDYIKSNT